MNDMAQTIIPKSDQLNADDLIAGPITITVTGVTIRPGQEQPISISFEGDKGKPYKACKSMCRVLVTAWGPDSKKYAGRSMTLYRDPSVKWGGMEVGGIRISHLSDIESPITLALTMTKANKKPYTVRPLANTRPAAQTPASAPPDQPEPHSDGLPDPLIVKAGEWAECGTAKYEAFWKGLTSEQRKHIGAAHHETFKQIAAQVPV